MPEQSPKTSQAIPNPAHPIKTDGPVKSPTRSEREAKIKAMESLARFKNVTVKVSSLPLISSGNPPEYDDLHPIIKRVHAAFGADRLMWGSDQTQIMGKNRGSYAQNADIVRKYAAAYLPAGDVQKMMHDTATRVFKWPV